MPGATSSFQPLGALRAFQLHLIDHLAASEEGRRRAQKLRPAWADRGRVGSGAFSRFGPFLASSDALVTSF